MGWPAHSFGAPTAAPPATDCFPFEQRLGAFGAVGRASVEASSPCESGSRNHLRRLRACESWLRATAQIFAALCQ